MTQSPFAARAGAALLVAFAILPQGRAAAQAPTETRPLAATLDPAVPSPEERFGQPIGADHFLVRWDQLASYWEELAAASERMVLDTIGSTEEGRPHLMAIVTSPENHLLLDHYRAIARRLALAQVEEPEARALAAEGKAVVWIDGGLHATEVLGAQQLMQTVYEMVARGDAETLRFLDDVIILFVHANPDGHALVGDWYMRQATPEERTTAGIPRLYQKYAGHDNNRDFYMANLAETRNMLGVMVREWFPQIVYNHHQTGPEGTVMFAPPFRGPANYHLDPLVLLGIDLVGAAMHSRFVREGKGGTTMRSGASYSTWWNGGLRTTPYFHNQIGLLTETIGHPNPIRIPFVPERHLQTNDMPLPIEPQVWHFRQSVDYSLTANRAVLDVASRFREQLLFNIWRMGRNSIERGSRDHWTVYPHELAEVAEAVGERGGEEEFRELLRTVDERDPRAYVIPSSQPDFPTATKFVNALIHNGIFVDRAIADFTLQGKTYPTGSFVVSLAQPFRPHVLDMFEPQDHPDDIPYPGGPPTPPYDNAGWTLAYQMGVEFDRVLDGLPAGLPLQRLDGPARPPEGRLTIPDGNHGFLLDHAANDALAVVSRLLQDGYEVRWLLEPVSVGDTSWSAGTFYLPERSGLAAELTAAAGTLGLGFVGVERAPGVRSLRLRQPRIGLVDVYGGSMEAGWTRFVLESFDIPYEVVYPRQLEEGTLASRFDALVLVDDILDEDRAQPEPGAIPEELRHRLGRVEVDRLAPLLRQFLEAGGAVLAIGTSTEVAGRLGVPVVDPLVEDTPEGPRPLPRSEYYVPGSVLEARVDAGHPLAHGLDERVNLLFSRSPVFQLPSGDSGGVTPVAWFDSPEPLRSGWAWGQRHLEGTAAVVEADVGTGKLFLYGPDVLFRGQSHEAFKLFLNALYYGTAGADPTP